MRLCLLILFYVLVALNILAFSLYGVDKYKAKHQLHRISEKTLLLIALCGGSIGALLGMLIFHHKTKHLKFRILLPLFFILHVAGGIFVFVELFVLER